MESLCEKYGLKQHQLPKHVAIIMDGNGRWASKRFMPRIVGHNKAVDRVREITEISARLFINTLTLYAFSDENWHRPEEEVSGLMSILRKYIIAEKELLIKNNIKFRIIGDKSKLPEDIVNLILALEQETCNNTGMNLCIALSYGSKTELLRSFKRIYVKLENKELSINDINTDCIEQHLDTYNLPMVDLMIRTSGEYRISNFLLWQIAYAELFFINDLWPDFDINKYIDILKKFNLRERRYGQISEQIINKEKK